MAKRKLNNRRMQKSRRSQQGRRTDRKIFRLHVEGRVTEREYFKLFASGTLGFSFPKTYGHSPKRLVDSAKNDKRLNSRTNASAGFREVWCVFDVDNHRDLEEAVSDALNSGINCAISNPCFELWLVLHVEDQTAFIDRGEIQKRSRDLNLIEGKRLSKGAAETLVAGLQNAIARAQRLETMHESAGALVRENPSSSVWRLMQSIDREAS